MNPALAATTDLLETLRDQQARGVPVHLARPPRWAEPCTACPVDAGPAGAVAHILHRAPSEPLPDGYLYRDPTCTEHLHDAVTWELHRGSRGVAVAVFAPGLDAEVAA